MRSLYLLFPIFFASLVFAAASDVPSYFPLSSWRDNPEDRDKKHEIIKPLRFDPEKWPEIKVSSNAQSLF